MATGAPLPSLKPQGRRFDPSSPKIGAVPALSRPNALAPLVPTKIAGMHQATQVQRYA